MADFSPEKYLENKSKFEDFEIIDRLEGHNNLNFIFISGEEKYVLRKRNEVSSDEQVLSHERTILDFLENKNFKFAPKSISFDGKKQIHIISYVGRENINLENLSDQKLREWTENLAELHKFSFEEFSKFCEKHDYSFSQPETPMEKLEKLEQDAESLKKQREQGNLLEFCQEKISVLKHNIESSKLRSAYLNHSDLSNSTRISEDCLYLIDWEYASFNYNSFSDLAVLFVHREFSEEQESVIKEAYEKQLDVPENFETKLKQVQNMRIVFDILWAIKRSKKLSDESEKQRMLDFASKQKWKYE